MNEIAGVNTGGIQLALNRSYLYHHIKWIETFVHV